jgi:hypothetical protein
LEIICWQENQHGKIKAMNDERGNVTEAGPSTPCVILGFRWRRKQQVINPFEDEREAKQIAAKDRTNTKCQSVRTSKHNLPKLDVVLH